jgi:hypothetical protein
MDLLEPAAASLLAEGREEAFNRAHIDSSSRLRPALGRYSGQPYATQGVVDGLLRAMRWGLHVLVVSGGYGLLRAEEPIQDYEAHMQRTSTVWRRRIPSILHDYVTRNRIRRTLGVFSRQYAAVVPDQLSNEDWRAVPSFAELPGRGSAMRVVPQRVARLLLELLRDDLHPGDGWVRV